MTRAAPPRKRRSPAPAANAGAGQNPNPPVPLVAYYRVSTERQGRSGLGLEAQQAAVWEYAERTGRTIIAEYRDVESGRRDGRANLDMAFARATVEGASIVVAKVDRLSRRLRTLLALVDGRVPIVFLDVDADVRSADGWMNLVIRGMFAEHEIRKGSERIKAAVAIRVKRKGPQKIGRARATRAAKKGGAARIMTAAAHRKQYGPVIRATRKDHTLGEAAAILNSSGVPTLSGALWTVANLSRFLKLTEGG